MINRILAIAALLMILVPGGFAQTERGVGTTAAPFLTMGVGARPQGMGGAFVAMTDDIHSLFWNPAGLARMNQSEIILMHNEWLADIAFDYIGAAFALGPQGTFGISTTIMNYGDMEVTNEQYQEGFGLKFSSTDIATGISYGYKFYDRFSLGATLKYVRQQIWNETATGVAFDIGTLLITPYKDIRLGMSISNFGTKMQMSGRDLLTLHDPDPTKDGNNDRIPSQIETERWKLPLTMRLGLAGDLIKTSQHRLTWATDWVVPNDNLETVNAGMEYSFREYAMLRAGYRNIRPSLAGDNFVMSDQDNAAGWTFGGGALFDIQGSKLSFDYAFESFFRLGSAHKYSASLFF